MPSSAALTDLYVLIPSHSLEDFPTELGDRAAEGLLNGWAVLWHPVLLAAAGTIPRWQRADDPPSVERGRLVVVPPHCDSQVTSEWISHGRSEGMHVITGLYERSALVAAVLKSLDNPPAVDSDLVADFLAFGHLHWQVEILTRHMRQFGNLDDDRLKSDAVNAAKSAVVGDETAARTYLKRCFEQLLEARERFYPVSCYLIDLCLVNPKLSGAPLSRLLADPTPVSLLAAAQDLTAILAAQPELQSVIRDGWHAGRTEIVGGEWAERCTPLLPLDSVIYELNRGRAALRELFGRNPATWGRRRYGLSALLPQVLKRSGYSGALHFVMDDGAYPDEEHSQLTWSGADGSGIASYSRIPLAADSASAFLRFPVRMAESMDHDHVAGLVFARWPELRTPWLEDFRRAHRYAPVVGEFVTFEKFFGASDVDGRRSEFHRAGYLTPFLVQAVARRETSPVSRYVEFSRRRRQFEGFDWFRATAELLRSGVVTPGGAHLEAALAESGPDHSDAPQAPAIDNELAAASLEAARSLAGIIRPGQGRQQGLLVLNPLSFPRHCVVDWPTDLAIPAAEAPVLARQFSSEVRQVVVEVPACGFACVPAPDHDAPLPAAPKRPLAEALVVRNEFLEIKLSDATGGIARLHTYGRGQNRLSQQIAWRFSREKTITIPGEGEPVTRKTWYTDMVLREHRVLADGPTLGAVETVGELMDTSAGKTLGTFRQLVRIWRGRPVAEVEIELGLPKAPEGDPWTNYVGLRFAWNDANQSLTRSLQETACLVQDESRFESPSYLELASESERTTILTGGLSFHRLTGPRMLDTLLVTEGESQRRFRFAVAVDQPYPLQAALDWELPATAVPVVNGPPHAATTGWFFHVNARNVQLRRVLPLRGEAARDGASGCIVRLQETEGQNRNFRLECCRIPTSARQVDLDGGNLHTFSIEQGAVLVSMAPYELCDVELRFT